VFYDEIFAHRIGSLEDALQKFKEREDALNLHKQDIKNTQALYKELSNSLSMRAMGWEHFRSAIVMRAKFNFRWLLEKRKYRGDLRFDHERGRLIVNVETNEKQQRRRTGEDEEGGNKGGKKDPRGLSGGEKSFSTICLLLSIWGAMNSPVRALDEFDVFMVSHPAVLIATFNPP
jgi:chromosome segregation ATPase